MERINHGCSLLTNKQGVSSVVVAGGGNKSGTLSSVEKMTRSKTGVWSSWTKIGKLPDVRTGFRMITNGENELFIVGGTTENYEYEEPIIKSVDGGKGWEETDHKLKFNAHQTQIISTDNLCE